jgi:RNA polymerase sigma-70 factor (ECF subfamily)
VAAKIPIQPAQAPEFVSDERRLVASVLGKDRKATAEFVDRCADWMYPFLRRRLVPRPDVIEDILQDILLAAWQALPTYRGDSSLQSWIFGIARHKIDDYYRKRIPEDGTSEDEEDSAPEPALAPNLEQQLDSSAQQEKVQQILSRLPESYALALIWRYRDEKSVREMAQLSGKTEKAMARLLARAREDFRRRWNYVEY